MPDDKLSPGSKSNGKESEAEPVKTADSDDRLKSVAMRIFASQQKVTVTPNSIVDDKGTVKGSSPGDGAVVAPTATPTSPSTAKSDTQVSEPEKGKTGEEADSQKKLKKPDKVDWAEEAKKHQSRADKLQLQITEEYTPLKTEFEKLKSENEGMKTRIESFTKDPVGFIQEYLPDLGAKLAQAKDPIALIEGEVTEFKKQLDEQFFKQYGEDWTFSEVEALRPGTPSFRYKLAIDDRISEVRSRQRDYIETRQREMEESKRQVTADREQLVKEFGFTEDDLKTVDDYLSKNPIRYYNLAQMVLLSKIVEKKLGSVVKANQVPPDISTAGGGADATRGKEKPKLSEDARKVVSRIGLGSFQQF